MKYKDQGKDISSLIFEILSLFIKANIISKSVSLVTKVSLETQKIK